LREVELRRVYPRRQDKFPKKAVRCFPVGLSGASGVAQAKLENAYLSTYERIEERINVMRRKGDTWYMALRKA
jgi:hypothetical protein